MVKVVITDSNLGEGAVERQILPQDIACEKHQVVTEDEVIAVGHGAAGLLVQWAPITRRVLESLPDLRVVVRYGIGLDNIDLDAADELGVEVRNVDDYCLDEVAEHTVALIQSVSRRLRDFDAVVSGGGWFPAPVPPPSLVAEDPVGIVGLGRIGRGVAERAASLGYPVFAWDPYAPSTAADGVERVDSLLELAAAVNHLTLHCPATADTNGLVDAEVLTALGPLGHLVNTSRGALVDEAALRSALDDGRLGWASLDVLVTEPPAGPSADLLGHPRILLTPHVGWYSTGAKLRLQERAATQMRDALLSPVSR